MTKQIEIGTRVFDGSGTEYVYGGPHEDMPGMTRIKFDFRSTGPNEIQTDLDQVAPLEVLEAVNLKDPRITVAKRPGMRGHSAAFVWCATAELPGGKQHVSWHKTKRDGTAEAAHRLAIADWHAGE